MESLWKRNRCGEGLCHSSERSQIKGGGGLAFIPVPVAPLESGPTC